MAFERVDEFNKIELKRLLSDESNLKELSDQTRYVVHNFLKQKYESRIFVLADGVLSLLNLIRVLLVFCSNMTPLNLEDNRIRDILMKSADRISKIGDLVGKDFVFLWSKPSEETVLKNDLEFFGRI